MLQDNDESISVNLNGNAINENIIDSDRAEPSNGIENETNPDVNNNDQYEEVKNPPVAANVEAEIVPEVQNIEIAVSKSQSEQTESTEIAVNEKLQNDNVVETKSPITRDEAITEKTGQYTESPELNSNDTEIQQENIKNKLKEIISDIDRVIENESEFPENESKPTDMNGVGNTNGMAPISLEGDHLNGEVEQKVSHLQES